MPFDHICKLPSCGIAFQHKDRFRVGCCKGHALEFNRLTVQHGRNKSRKAGRRRSKPGCFGPETVAAYPARRALV